MAQKRMFSLSVVDTDKFLEMPISSRLLYYELGMRADDDGFVGNWKKILLFTGLKEDDMKLLIAKQFILPFETGVIVIRHWRLNNYLQNDRTKPTIYQEELKHLQLDNGEYNLVIDNCDEENQNFLQLNWKEKREKAYKESELPYSFDYKIRNAFKNKKCPICNFEMKEYVNAPHRPTIQHNIPISKGGKHELGNISVICHQCNVSLKDTITDELNAQEVIDEWNKINECIQDCIHSIEENSIEKNRIDKNNIYSFIEENFGRTLSPIEYEQISQWKDNQLTRYAIKQAVLNGKYNLKYINAILNNWEKNRITTVQEAQQEISNFKKANVPEWFDKDIKQDVVSDEEEQDFLEKLKKVRGE